MDSKLKTQNSNFSRMLTLSAHAKVNLTLEVLGRRDDGYHEISSVLQTINLVDVLSFEPATEIKFECLDPGTGQTNHSPWGMGTNHRSPFTNHSLMASFEKMVLKAARLLSLESGVWSLESGVPRPSPTLDSRLSTRKGAVIRAEIVAIPGGIGLGSSASIPAAVLRGLNQLWSLELSRENLSQLAARIGSDAPFFIYGGTALAEGRGEKITILPTLPATWLVLLKPAIDPVPSKTAVMYSLLDSSHFTTGAATRKLVSELRRGRPLQSSLLCNTFEGVAFDFFPQIDEYRRRFLAAGASSVHLVGAGPMLFTLVPDEVEGEALARRLNGEGMEALLVRTTAGILVGEASASRQGE
ncbi:MAG: 4-diphosphocytidyl-2-C-methyl-D-erythritol kinase [Dehalococcoidia bacterium]|nr:4-diphosphocytidyl-2-C-methyl-D-erythritol kinase [Chloroflexota bacterium]